MSRPGFLTVFSDPGSTATLEEFQDWYDKEHVPLRMSNLRSFLSGARYSAVDGKHPSWLAMYEIDDVAFFAHPSYTVLREKRSAREGELIQRLGILDRRTGEALVGEGLDTGEEKDVKRSTGLKVGRPSRGVVTVGVNATGVHGSSWDDALRQFLNVSKKGIWEEGWVRTRVVKVFDKGVTGTNEQWVNVDVPEYLGVIGAYENMSKHGHALKRSQNLRRSWKRMCSMVWTWVA